jgi:kinesin family protein 1
VDLAGSERVTLSGASGVRLKEANNINRSLSVLGDVIKCLGDSKTKRGHIPYRNSTLTLILKDSLGGNSHTVMLTNVSPSSADYEETVSTLKYADRAKKVRMKVNANVTNGLLATDRSAVDLVPLLQAEVSKLKELLRAQQEAQSYQSSEVNQEEVVKSMQMRVAELEKQLADRESLIRSLEVMRLESAAGRVDLLSPGVVARSFIKKRSGSARSAPVVVVSDDVVDTSLPRIVNLNQDPLFSECLVYYMPVGTITAGSDDAAVDVLISGPDVLSRHCAIHNDGENIWVEPIQGACVYLNGDLVPPRSRAKANRVLNHLDRIALGRFHLFRYGILYKPFLDVIFSKSYLLCRGQRAEYSRSSRLGT